MFKKFFINYRKAYTGLPKAVWMLAFVVFVNRSGSIVLFFMTLYLTKELGYSIAVAGRMVSIYGFGSLLGAYLGGWLSDKMGPRQVQVLSLLTAGMGFIILGYLQTLLAIGVCMFLLAALGESFRPANSTALAQYCPPELRARGFALARLAINLGVTIGPAVGGMLATINYKYLFWLDGLTCVCAAFLLWLFFHKKEKEYILETPAELVTVSSPWKDRPFLLILLLIFLNGLTFVQLFNTWPVYMRESYGLPENQIGLLLGFNPLLIVLMEMPLVHKLERYNATVVMAVGAIFLSIGFAMLPLGRGFRFASVTVIIWTIGEMLVFPLITAFVANRAEGKSRGKYMGMFNFSFALSMVAAPAFGTFVYELFGAAALWYGIGALGMVISAGFFFTGRYQKKNNNPQLQRT